MNVKRKVKGDSNENTEGRRSCNGHRKLSKKMKKRQAQARKKARLSGREFVSYQQRQPNPEVGEAAAAAGMGRAQYVARKSFHQGGSTTRKSVSPQIVYTSMVDMAEAVSTQIREREEARYREVEEFSRRHRRRGRSGLRGLFRLPV